MVFVMFSFGFLWIAIILRFSYGLPMDCHQFPYFFLVDSSGLLWSSPVFPQCRDGISHNTIHTRTHKLMHLLVPQQLAVWGSGGQVKISITVPKLPRLGRPPTSVRRRNKR